MQEALDRATTMTLDARQTIYRAISNSGIVRSESASPLFYYLNFNVRPMYLDDYAAVSTSVTGGNNNGLTPYTVSIPHGHTFARGTAWPSSGTVRVAGANQMGDDIVIDGLNLTGTILPLDYVQFAGSTKVYQVAAMANSVAGQATITLNTPLVSTPADNAEVTFGSNVSFNMLAVAIPSVTTVPGLNGNPMWQYSGEFQLREVLTP